MIASTRVRQGGSQRGAVLVEFALSSALLMVTLFGIVAGGLSVYRYNMIATLAQEGARYGAVRGLKSTSPFYGEGTLTQLTSYLQSRNPSVPITVAVSANPNTLNGGATFQVTVSTTWLPATGYSLSAFTMSAQARATMTR